MVFLVVIKGEFDKNKLLIINAPERMRHKSMLVLVSVLRTEKLSKNLYKN